MVRSNKVCIVGMGVVGSSIMASLLRLHTIDKIILIDKEENKARGEAIDATHMLGLNLLPNMEVAYGDYEECKDSDIIIIAAGVARGSNQDRMELININADVVRRIMQKVVNYTRDAIIIMVSNPVDILTYIAYKEFNYDRRKIIGTGTLLDTIRLKSILSKELQISPGEVHGVVLGEHGKNAFIPWSICTVGGIPIDQYLQMDETYTLDKARCLNKVRGCGREIIKFKGYTNFGITEGVCKLVDSILLNQRSIIPLSTIYTDINEGEEIAFSMLCIVGRNGIEKVFNKLKLKENEERELVVCIEYMKQMLKEVAGYKI